MMADSPIIPQAHDVVALLMHALSDPEKHKAIVSELSAALAESKDMFTRATEARVYAESTLKQAQKFDGQAKADAIARETALKQREDALAASEADFARKHEGHTFELRALESKKADLQEREAKHQQDALQLSSFVSALDARAQALAKREAAVNDLDAKNKAFAADLERKKAHLDKMWLFNSGD